MSERTCKHYETCHCSEEKKYKQICDSIRSGMSASFTMGEENNYNQEDAQDILSEAMSPLLSALDERDERDERIRELDQKFDKVLLLYQEVSNDFAHLLAHKERLECVCETLLNGLFPHEDYYRVRKECVEEFTRALAPDEGGKIDCFIGDKIKDGIKEGGQAPVVDKVTLATAKEEADIYLSKPKPVCETCKGTGTYIKYKQGGRATRSRHVRPCPNCTKGGGGGG